MSNGDFNNTGWFIAGISTMVATLSAAITALFKLVESKNTESIDELRKQVTKLENRLEESDKRHDDCQIDRAKLSIEVALLKEYVARNDNT